MEIPRNFTKTICHLIDGDAIKLVICSIVREIIHRRGIKTVNMLQTL